MNLKNFTSHRTINLCDIFSMKISNNFPTEKSNRHPKTTTTNHTTHPKHDKITIPILGPIPKTKTEHELRNANNQTIWSPEGPKAQKLDRAAKTTGGRRLSRKIYDLEICEINWIIVGCVRVSNTPGVPFGPRFSRRQSPILSSPPRARPSHGNGKFIIVLGSRTWRDSPFMRVWGVQLRNS